MADLIDYWITFRIENDKTWQDRYDSLVEAVEENCDSVWDETTSFYLADSQLEIDPLGQRLVAGLNPRKDILVIRKLNVSVSRYFGAVKNLDLLKAFLPTLKKL